MWCYVSFLQPGSHPVCRAKSPGAAHHSWDSAQLWSSWPISAPTHTRRPTLASTTVHLYRVKTATHKNTYVPTFISALLSLFVSQLCGCFLPRGHEHWICKKSLASRLGGTVGFEMIMNLWARISHVAPCLMWKQKKWNKTALESSRILFFSFFRRMWKSNSVWTRYCL